MQFLVQAAQPAAQFLAHVGVERAKRFVQQQHPRLDGQRPRQRHPLALAARQLVRIARRGVAQLHQFEQPLHALGDLGRRRTQLARPGLQAKGDVLEHRHVPEQRVVLEHEADPALAHVAAGGVLAVELDAPGVGLFEAGDDAQQRGLAAAGRAQQRHQLAGGDVQADVVERLEGAKALADLVDDDAHAVCPCGRGALSGIGASWACPARHSTTVLMPSVTSASSASSEAQAKAATKLYSL